MSRKVLGISGLLLTVVMLAGCSLFSRSELEVVKASMRVNEYGVPHIVGKARNNSDYSYYMAQIDFDLYNSQGVKVGSTFAVTTDWDPGEVWEFDAQVPVEGVTKFKVVSIHGY